MSASEYLMAVERIDALRREGYTFDRYGRCILVSRPAGSDPHGKFYMMLDTINDAETDEEAMWLVRERAAVRP